jgi:putative inorganic carbon (hco3(-)) transporter
VNTDKPKIWLFYLLSALFIAINAYALINRETVAIAFLPFILLLVMFAFFAMDKLLLLIVFLTPLSIPLKHLFPELAFDMALPTEPLLFGLLVIFIFKQLLEPNYDKKILKHPVSYAIYFYLFWMLVTSITSTMPIVSIKFLLAKLWFIVAFYFLLIILFRKYSNIFRFYWAYILPLIIVILITLFKHSHFGFDQRTAHFVMNPFYKDHTSYGAALAMFLPILIGLFSLNYYKGRKYFLWILSGLLGLFTFAIILSYTRAAWVSLIAALGVYLIIRLKINYRWILAGFGVLVAIFFIYRTDIMIVLEQNKTDSSSDFKEHVQSISNVATDASNKERINRWNCAIRMFKEKPFIGWGPGTYQFQYAPFQKSYEKTIISTNAGDMGNAHSEYLGPLSESGIMGMLSLLIVIITVVFTALKRYKHTKDKETRTVLIMSLTALVTYFVHGFLNNFLDTDKASVPYWGFIAIIVAIDLYHTNREDIKKIS